MDEHKSYRSLVKTIRAYGTSFPKKHGNWVRLRLMGQVFLSLDTWSSAIVLKCGSGEYNEWTGFEGTQLRYLGLDFGGFENKAPETVELLNTGISAVLEATIPADAISKEEADG